jgi:pyruvate/2-oxoglutarate dehydrogenase complex dihydrolipoamide acyltransferase (E2) component
VRSPEAGVIKSFHANAQDTVKVGAPLFTLDSGATGKSGGSAPAATPKAAPAPAAAAPAPAPAPAAAAPAPAAAPKAAPAPASSGARVPSIHFRHGNRRAIDEQTSLYSAGSAAAGSSAPAHAGSYLAALDAAFPSKATRSILELPPMFGRPALDVAEGFWIESGGAYGAPPPPPADKKGGAKGGKPAKA